MDHSRYLNRLIFWGYCDIFHTLFWGFWFIQGVERVAKSGMKKKVGTKIKY